MTSQEEGRSLPWDRPTSNSITSPNTSRTDNASTFGVALDLPPLSTTRRCEGLLCWCHVGATISWPITHDQEMARMFREIRGIEIGAGVMGI